MAGLHHHLKKLLNNHDCGEPHHLTQYQNVVHFPQDLLREVLQTQYPLVWGRSFLMTHHFQQSVWLDLREQMDMATYHNDDLEFCAFQLSARSAACKVAFCRHQARHCYANSTGKTTDFTRTFRFVSPISIRLITSLTKLCQPGFWVATAPKAWGPKGPLEAVQGPTGPRQHRQSADTEVSALTRSYSPRDPRDGSRAGTSAIRGTASVR